MESFPSSYFVTDQGQVVKVEMFTNCSGHRAGILHILVTFCVCKFVKALQDTVIQISVKKMPAWKSCFALLMRREVTSIKYALKSLPICCLLVLQCPMSVVRMSERIQMDFFRKDKDYKTSHFTFSGMMKGVPAYQGMKAWHNYHCYKIKLNNFNKGMKNCRLE